MRLMIKRLFGVCLVLIVWGDFVEAQKKRSLGFPKTTQTTNVNNAIKGVVINEKLAVLRSQPSFYAELIQRMRTGRTVLIIDKQQTDGVLFYKVSVPPKNFGWVQAEALVTASKKNDDFRLARLIQFTKGYDQIELITIFLNLFPKSSLKVSLLLLLGDLMEEVARKISIESNRRLNNAEISAGQAPFHSFYLNYSGLDRYRRLGIVFLFNPETKTFHYNGESWKEILKTFPTSKEAEEAKKRLEQLQKNLNISSKQS